MKQIKWAVLVAAIALVGYAAWIALSDPEQIAQALTRVGWLGFAVLCGISLCNYLIRYMRWCLFMRTQQQSFPLVDGFICYVSGFALITTPGKVGESVRALFFKERHHVSAASSFAGLLGERVTDLLAGILISSAGFVFFNNLWWACVIAIAVCVVILLVVFKSNLIERISQHCLPMLPELLARWLKPLVMALPDFFAKTRAISAPNVFSMALLLATLAWFIEGLGFAWLAQQLGVDASVMLLCSVFTLSLIAGVVTPGGVGSVEAAMAFFLIALGATPAAALVIALVCRFATFWFAIVLGMSALLYLMRGKKISHALLEASNG